METAREKEFHNALQYANLFLIISISAVIITVELTKVGWIDNTYVRDVIYKYIHKTPQFFEKNFLASLLLISVIFLAMLSPSKPSMKASKNKGLKLLTLSILFYMTILIISSHNTNEFYPFILIISIVLLIVLLIAAGTNYNSLINVPKKDLFNRYNEQFPQNETIHTNDLSVTYIHQYLYKNKWRVGCVPVVAPDRGVLILGGQGSGKTFTCFNPAIYQNLEKGFSLCVYDYAYPDLSKTVFNGLVNALHSDKYTFGKRFNGEPIIPEFNSINFEDLRRSNRSNPFRYMDTIDECFNMCKNLLYNLNKSWIDKEGDFWSTSAVNLLTTYVWFLKIIERENPNDPQLSQVCTLPHAINLLTIDINEIITAISCEPELDAYSNMFVQGLKNQAGNQIAGQIASVQAGLAPLSSPNVSWVMTGDDMELEINNPEYPRIITMANYTPKAAVYGAALSVYMGIIMKRSYKYRERKFSIMVDELPTMYLQGLDEYIATIRKHKGCVWMGIQDIEQLNKNYGKAAADVIVNTCGTIMSGLVNGSTAERLSKMFGKTEQESFSASVGKDTSVSLSTQSKELLPAAKIMSLSQGQFVGKFADRFEIPIEQKLFSGYFVVPDVEQKISELPLKQNVSEAEMNELVAQNMARIRNDIKRIREYCAENYIS